MAKLYNLARVSSATVGAGTITLGAAVSGYLTFANAGVSNGDVVFYGIKDGANSEVGIGTYTAAGTTLTRGPYKSTNANAAISLSGSAEVYITPLASDGGDILFSTATPLQGFDTAINLQLNATVAGNALTIAVKGNNGADPSSTNPVLVCTRSSAGATSNTSPGSNGSPQFVPITAALSVTVPSGQALGTANSVPFRLWLVAISNNAGGIELAVINCVVGAASPTAIVGLPTHNLITTTAIAAAPSAGVYYSTTARTSVPFAILGFVEFAAGQATAGTYATAPTSVQLFGPGIKKPGDIVQSVYFNTTTQTNVTSSTMTSTSVAASISPTSAPNLVKFCATGSLRNGSAAASHAIIQMFRGATALNSAVDDITNQTVGPASLTSIDAPGTTAATTYTVKLSSSDNVSQVSFPYTGVSPLFGTLILEEVMV